MRQRSLGRSRSVSFVKFPTVSCVETLWVSMCCVRVLLVLFRSCLVSVTHKTVGRLAVYPLYHGFVWDL